MTDLLALDVATTTGFARGKIGDVPVCGSTKFGTDDADVVFAAAMTWLNEYLAEIGVPDMMIIESLLPPTAMKDHTSRQVRDRLAGLHGIVRAVAHKHGVVRIAEAAVADVRAHFISAAKLKRKQAKAAVMAKCAALGWEVADDNAGDAAALWSYGCAIIDPATALMVVPLFNPKLQAAVQP